MRRSIILCLLATAWLGLAQPSWSQGTIAYYQPETPIPLWIPPDSFDIARQFPFSFDGGSTPDLTFAYGWTFIGVRSEGAGRILIQPSPPPNIGGSVAPLPSGFLIGSQSESDSLRWFAGVPGADPAADFDPIAIYLNGIASGPFAGQRAYMGVEFERAGATHYGWLLLQVSGEYAAIGTIESWAWETRPGVPILAGAVPEPSTWALLGTGGLLFLWYGRRKNTG